MSSIPNTPPLSLSDLQSLRAAMVIAMASPVLRGSADGKSVEFRSVDEAVKAIAFIDEEMGRLQTPQSRVSLASHKRGQVSGPGWPRPGAF